MSEMRVHEMPLLIECAIDCSSASVVGTTCKELYGNGATESGVYVVKPGVRAYCSMGLLNSGWTVVARKLNYSNVFASKKYKDFVDGFGDFSGSYFLGLDTLHEMTSTSRHEAYIGMEYSSEYIPFAFVRYDRFAVGEKSSGYKLSLGSYIDNVPGQPDWTPGGDELTYHRGSPFYAKDSSQSNCGKDFGGWWYARCDHPQYSACNYNKWYGFPDQEIMNFVFAIRQI